MPASPTQKLIWICVRDQQQCTNVGSLLVSSTLLRPFNTITVKSGIPMLTCPRVKASTRNGRMKGEIVEVMPFERLNHSPLSSSCHTFNQ